VSLQLRCVTNSADGQQSVLPRIKENMRFFWGSGCEKGLGVVANECKHILTEGFLGFTHSDSKCQFNFQLFFYKYL
jgi:hypothetical protein